MDSIISLTAVLLLCCCIVTSDDDFYALDDNMEDITDDAEATKNDTFADVYDDTEKNSSRPELYDAHINRGFDPPFAMSRQIGMKSQEITKKEKSSSPNDTADEEAVESFAQAYFPSVMQVREYALDENAYKSTSPTPDAARRRDSPLLFIDDYHKKKLEEDRKRRELLEQGYEKYRHINFTRGRNIVPVNLFFNVNPEIRPKQFEPKLESVPFPVARSYKTLRGNDVKTLRLIDETALEPGSGEVPQKVILVDEVPDQHFQDDLEITNDIDPDLLPNPAETYPKKIPRIYDYDEVQQGASWLEMPSINSVYSLIEQREEKEITQILPEVYDGKASKIPIPVYGAPSIPVNIETSESIPLSSVLNLTTNSTSTRTNMFTVRPEFATPSLSVISDLVQDDYDWKDKGERKLQKSPVLKKKSSGILGWRGLFRKHKKMGVQQHQDFPPGEMTNEKRFVIVNPVRGKEENLLPTQKSSLLRQSSQRMNYQYRSKQLRRRRRQKVNSGLETVQLNSTNKFSSSPFKQHSVKRTLEYGGQRTRSGVSTKIRLWNQGQLNLKPRKKVRRSCNC